MKKISALFLAVVLVMGLTACGGPDVSKLTESYNALSKEYNAMVDVINGTEYAEDEEFVTGMNEIAEKITSVKSVIENPGDYDQDQIDELLGGIEQLRTWVSDSEALISGDTAE